MNVFVGREKEVADAVAVLRDIDRGLNHGLKQGVVWDVVGVHGIGKSMFLEHVQAEAAALDEPPAILAVDMTQRGLDDGFRGDYGPNASAAVLWQTFVHSRELMLDCANYFRESLRCEDFDEFRHVCDLQSKRADAFLAAHDLRVEHALTRSPSVVDQAVRTRVREFQKIVDDAFLEAWGEFTVRRRVLVTLDPFEGVAPNELGHWLVQLSLQLPKTLTMLARVPANVNLAPGHPRMHQLDLPYFTVEQVDTYLRERFRSEQMARGIAQAVHDYTDGHPGGTSLAAKLILEKGTDIDARALRRILDRLPDDPQRRWGTLVRLIVDAVHDPLLRKAVDAASVALSFDEPLLAALLRSDGEEHAAGDAVKALKDHRLTQPVLDGVRRNRYRLVEFIRLSLADDYRDTHPTRWTQLHARAAEHYFTLLQQEEEADAGAGIYGQWYRYERADWQANKQDWLYHSGQLPERRELTRARFVLVFLEAFWWWGCYQKFDFNQRLLEDWERATARWAAGSASGVLAQDQQLAEALSFLLGNYPLGHVKPATAAWDDMRSRLQLVQSLCGLSPGTRLPSDPDERRQLARARAMIRIFLAHTRRFRDPADTNADRYYGEALRTFEKLADEWVVAWLLFETADLALERGQTEKAVSLVARSSTLTLKLTLAGEDESGEDKSREIERAAVDELDVDDELIAGWDYELLANLHRARADAHWLHGEIDRAAVEYGRAVASAYWFQGQPHAPDPYTHQFYEEITGRAAERVLTLADKHDGEHDGRALSFATTLRAQLPAVTPVADAATAVRSGQVADVRAALFPRGPDPATELRYDNTPFMIEWRVLWDDRSDPAAELRGLVGEDGST